MNQKLQLGSEFINQTKAMLSAAQALLTSRWEGANAHKTYETAEALADKAQNSGVEELGEALLGFSAYLSSFADSTVRPSDNHLDQLRALAEAVTESLARYETAFKAASQTPVKALAPPAVLFFGANAFMSEVIARRIAPLGYRVEPHASPDTILAAIADNRALALILDANIIPAWLAATEQQAPSSRVPLVVVTNTDAIELRLSAMRCGAEAFFIFPDDADRVAPRLAGLIADRTEPYRVLIIDDDPSMRLFCDSVLRHNNMVTRAVGIPEDALLALAEFTPDVIVADLYMPGLTGFELLSLFRAHPRTAFTPVVMLSGDTDTEKRFATLHIGGDDYLTKPIRPRHLIAAIISRARRSRWLRRELMSMR